MTMDQINRTARRNTLAMATTGPPRAAPHHFPYYHGSLKEHDGETERIWRNLAEIEAQAMWDKKGR